MSSDGGPQRKPADRTEKTLFPLHFDAIRYWTDEDSGHWEETRKIEASSIGAVVAWLAKLRAFLYGGRARVALNGQRSQVSDSFMKTLERRGRKELHRILPHECIQTSSAKKRRYDGVLLFLVYPLEVVGDAMGNRILKDIAENLEGSYGIKRYVGDSYWAADYKDKLDSVQRTVDFSHSIELRNKLLAPGQEAQWCLFDPIMSAALGQLTGKAKGVHELQCPEAYYLERGRYAPNDQTPLLWTQANLLVAIKLMGQSLSG